MKKLFFILLLIPTLAFGQSAKEMLSEIEGKWSLDNNGNVTFTRIIEVPNTPKDDLFTHALSYFTYKYNSGDDVIQVNDKEKGVIVGKGIYPRVHVGVSLLTTVVDATHIIRIDAKDNRVRAIITLQQYKIEMSGGNDGPSYSTRNISETYPINPKGVQKTVMAKAFYKSYKQAFETLDGLEKTLKEGNTGFENDNDW